MLFVLAFCKALNTEHTSSILATVAAVVTGFCERIMDCHNVHHISKVLPPGLKTCPHTAGGVSDSVRLLKTDWTSSCPAMNCSNESNSTDFTLLSSISDRLSTLEVPCLQKFMVQLIILALRQLNCTWEPEEGEPRLARTLCRDSTHTSSGMVSQSAAAKHQLA